MLNVLSAIIVLVALTMPFFAFIPLMNDVWSFSSQYHRRDVYAKTIPYTTRQPREGEIDGKHYRFVSQAAFDEMVAKDEFIEYGENNGVFYGTPRNPELEQTDLKRSTSVLHLRKLADFKAATIVLEKERPDELFGMELLKGPEHIYVYSVTPGSPAHRAFVRPNMQLLAINGEDMTHAKLSDAQQRLATAGPRVELFLRYDKDGQDKAVAVAKETASTPLSKRLEVGVTIAVVERCGMCFRGVRQPVTPIFASGDVPCLVEFCALQAGIRGIGYMLPKQTKKNKDGLGLRELFNKFMH
eukprot:m.150161 g.150161  ORF g.150161 m.150161 type:complete len:299 (-) comp16167_c8_seq9:26-922(-)